MGKSLSWAQVNSLCFCIHLFVDDNVRFFFIYVSKSVAQWNVQQLNYVNNDNGRLKDVDCRQTVVKDYQMKRHKINCVRTNFDQSSLFQMDSSLMPRKNCTFSYSIHTNRQWWKILLFVVYLLFYFWISCFDEIFIYICISFSSYFHTFWREFVVLSHWCALTRSQISTQSQINNKFGCP